VRVHLVSPHRREDLPAEPEGWWLSWESTRNCLYLSYWTYAAAWKLEGGRLVRTDGGAVASVPVPQSWPLADAEFIMALPPGNPAALTVEEVDEPLGPVEKLVDSLVPVYEQLHAPEGTGDPWRARYGTNPDRRKESGQPAGQRYDSGVRVAFFGVSGPVQGESTVPVYLLRMRCEKTQTLYYKLSLKTEEDGYTLDPGAGGPNFTAFSLADGRTHLKVVYQHAALNPDGTTQRYLYDFWGGPHDGWGGGVAVFRAISPETATPR
jgi:hypothetical protein